MLILASFVIVIAGMKAAESIVVPFLLSVFISIIALPPFDWLQQKRIPRGIALGIIILSFLIFIFLIGLLIGTSINDFSSRLPLYEERLQNQTQEIISWLKERKMVESDFQIDSWFNPAVILKIVGDVLNQVSNLFTNAFLILLIVVFILLEAASLPDKIKKMFANPDASLARIQSVTKNINKYIALKTILNLCNFYSTIFLFIMEMTTICFGDC
jgi:predicted PurR-regulated permease PerM